MLLLRLNRFEDARESSRIGVDVCVYVLRDNWPNISRENQGYLFVVSHICLIVYLPCFILVGWDMLVNNFSSFGDEKKMIIITITFLLPSIKAVSSPVGFTHTQNHRWLTFIWSGSNYTRGITRTPVDDKVHWEDLSKAASCSLSLFALFWSTEVKS